MKESKEEWSISYKQIGIIVLSIAFGVVIALLSSNSQGNATSNFTTTELIGFVMSVILSGASIVLAIAAIALGKSSEQAVINRSDQSIRLQTEIFTKTTDALHAIKSSTDVTEKRIEDIIAGRAGDISKQIAELASDEGSAGPIDLKELEEKIKKSLTQSFEKKELTQEEKEERARRRSEIRHRQEEYQKHHDALLYALANKPGVKIEKLGHGTPRGEEEPKDRYDAIFTKEGNKIAVSTFMPRSSERLMTITYSEVLAALASPLEDQDISKLYLIYFEYGDEKANTAPLKESLALMKEEIASRIQIVDVSYDGVEEWTAGIEL